MPSGAKKRKAARRKKKEQEACRINNNRNHGPIILAEKKSDGDVSSTVSIVGEAEQRVGLDYEAATGTEKELKSQENNVASTTDSLLEKASRTPGHAPLQEASVNKSKPDETSVVSEVVRPKSNENEQNEGKVEPLPDPLAETSKHVENIKNSEIPKSSEAKPPFLSRTSWLSCCGLFDVVTGSDR